MIRPTGYYANPKISESALSIYWASVPEDFLPEKEKWELFKMTIRLTYENY
jgi:hypothetical protein